MEQLSIWQVLTLISGAGCIFLYLKNKNDNRLQLRKQIDLQQARANELETISKQIEISVTQKKEAYEQAKKNLRSVSSIIPGIKSDSSDGTET